MIAGRRMINTTAYFENIQAVLFTCALYWLENDIRRAGRYMVDIAAYSESNQAAMSHRIVDEDMYVKL